MYDHDYQADAFELESWSLKERDGMMRVMF